MTSYAVLGSLGCSETSSDGPEVGGAGDEGAGGRTGAAGDGASQGGAEASGSGGGVSGDEVGSEKWTGYSFYLPGGWKPDSVDESVAQIHAGTAKPRMLFVLSGDSLDFFHRGDLTCGSDADANTKYALSNVAAGNWYDIVIRIVAADSSHSADGVIQVWMNGALLVDLSNLATVYDCSPQVGTLKLGVYKYNWHLSTNAESEPNVVASESAKEEHRHYFCDNVSIYLGPDGYDRVDPSRGGAAVPAP